MKTKTIHQINDTTDSVELHLALELSQAGWMLGYTIGVGQIPRLQSMRARVLVESFPSNAF